MMTWCFLGGRFETADTAALPIADRGFRFGDGAFETVRLHHGVACFLPKHVARLRAGLAALQIPWPDVDFAAACRELSERNAASEGILRIAVSRGVGSKGYLPTFETPPTVLIEYLPPRLLPATPARLALSAWRKAPLACTPGNFKLAGQGLNATLARMEAQEFGCDEVIQLTLEGHIAEASGANIFWVKGGTLYTPSLSCGVLAGITRSRVLAQADMPVEEGEFPLATLESAEEVFLTNAWLQTWPVAAITPLGWEWETGAATKAIHARLHEELAKETA